MFEVNVQFEMKYGLIPKSVAPPQITSCEAVHSSSFAFQNSTVSVRNDPVYSFPILLSPTLVFTRYYHTLFTMSGLHLDQTWEMLHYLRNVSSSNCQTKFSFCILMVV